MKIKKYLPQKILKPKRKISTLDITVFFRKLSTLITAGIPLVQCCEILLQSEDHSLLNAVIQSVKNDLECGRNFSASLLKHPRYFDPLTCHLIQIAEYTGTLDKILIRISNHKEKFLALKNKIKQALFYPAIIAIAALVVSMTLLTYVVPQFAELFQTMHGKLPAFTQSVIQFSDCIRHQYGYIFIPIAVLSFVLFYYKKSTPLKIRIDQFILNIPAAGLLLKKFILARFARTLSTLIGAGVPISEALNLLKNINHNHVYQTAARKLEIYINAGQQLHFAMQFTGVFPPMMMQMVKVGEESGFLPEMLEKIAEFYESEMDYWLGNFSQILEPLIIIILGVLIGGLVIAMYLPIFKLGTVF